MFDAERMNADCACVTLDLAQLRANVGAVMGDLALSEQLFAAKPNLFSPRPVYLAAQHAHMIHDAVAMIESITRLPGWQSAAIAGTDPINSIDRGTHGVFMGYDFHIGVDGPRLIEINTNAGGALINAYLLEAQRACCSAMEGVGPFARSAAELGDRFVQNFRDEWRGSGRQTELKTIAIVDTSPTEQYLYEEFVLFQRLFERAGLTAVIADPKQLSWRDGTLWAGGLPVDLVYNRLTDFALSGEDVAALRQAYQGDAIVLTPDPHLHASKADKRRLVQLCDQNWLTSIGVSATVAAQVAAIVPPTRLVRADAAAELWSIRKSLFFKPVAGYGGKAAYRGDKLTRSTFDAILAGDYVAQAVVPPSTRTVIFDNQRSELKLDVRAYAYGGDVLLMAARLYRGQTTNFRTIGGGWAPVFSAAEMPALQCNC